jgi:hypothetical protein
MPSIFSDRRVNKANGVGKLDKKYIDEYGYYKPIRKIAYSLHLLISIQYYRSH